MIKLFLKYIYQYRYTIILFVVFSVIFAVVFSLYRLEAEAVLYSCILCAVVGIFTVLNGFRRFIKKCREREYLMKNILIATEKFPEPQTVAESDYQEIIEKLRRINSETETKFQNERQESIDYYTAWVHQIKTPISAMQMILKSEDTAEHRELLAELFRIEQYTGMVLSYFRLSGNSSDFVFRNYELNDIIKKAVHRYAPQFIRKKIKLNYNPVSVTVLTDEKWLLFIIEQLLSNAVKYTDSGSVTISVSQNKILRIADTGIGIAPEDIPRIFEKGFTGYNGRADSKSTGLGLYLCKKASDKLSHKICVESEEGRGSIFSLYLERDELEIE